MKLQGLLLLGLLSLGGSAYAEGGCPAGYTPVNNGQNWACIPGGNDVPVVEQQAAPQPTGYWEKTWGAIVGHSSQPILGTALGASSEDEAKQLAISDCRAKGGGAGCRLEITYHNQCAVLVTGDKFYNTYSAGSIERATELSMEVCRRDDTNCRVYYSACTKPIFHRY